MIIGVPKEIKNNENRVALTPAGVVTYIQAGHTVLIETNAGIGSAFTNDEYIAAGADIIEDAADVWTKADMIMKVKEPLESEYKFFREGLIIFTYLHLAANPKLAKELVEKGVIGVAYETVQVGRALPLLAPMSEVAGRMGTLVGANYLQTTHGGKGILLSGVPGVERGKVTIVGGGNVGTNAAKMAIGLGADVTILDINADRLRQLDDIFGNSIQTLMSSPYNIAKSVAESDLVIGAVLIPGAKAPKLITEEMIKTMKPGSVVVDPAIDQGGSVETSIPTTHDNPTFIKHDVVHYCVANMPGAVARTSTMALTNATVPYGVQIANKGITMAITENPALKLGVNTALGKVTNATVAKDLGYEYDLVEKALEKEIKVL
jgi:alanine dehydrogenase